MKLPDAATNDRYQEFRWDDATGLSNIFTEVQGNTIVFDSFSDEDEVRRRNGNVINISKIQDASRRFVTDFTVRASGEVTAILNADTVADYRVVDGKRRKRGPKPSFSSVLSQHHNDSDESEPISAITALSSVAGKLDDAAARTEQLRKRCRTALEQRSSTMETSTSPVTTVTTAGNFFESIPRPDEVNRTLLETTILPPESDPQAATPPVSFGWSLRSSFIDNTSGRRMLPPISNEVFSSERLSSSEIVFGSHPGLMDFRRSSEEIIALSALTMMGR